MTQDLYIRHKTWYKGLLLGGSLHREILSQISRKLLDYDGYQNG